MLFRSSSDDPFASPDLIFEADAEMQKHTVGLTDIEAQVVRVLLDHGWVPSAQALGIFQRAGYEELHIEDLVSACVSVTCADKIGPTVCVECIVSEIESAHQL